MLGCSKIKGIFYIPLHGGGGGECGGWMCEATFRKDRSLKLSTKRIY